MKKISKKNKGFSLVEIIVAMFIFVIMMTATVAFFGKSMFSYRSARAIQKDLESAQFAMNLVAKSLRTSTVFGSGITTDVKIFDYSQGKCIEYKFESSALKYSWGVPAGANDEEKKINCPTTSMSAPQSITAGTVTGLFNVVPTSSGVVGKVTISMKVCPETGCSGNPKDEAKIQSTVSLRDYKEAGL